MVPASVAHGSGRKLKASHALLLQAIKKSQSKINLGVLNGGATQTPSCLHYDRLHARVL
jgi:hypothetical protein